MHIERIIPNTKEWSLYYSNHICRYIFAKEQLKQKKGILDIACGVGYGSKYLAEHGFLDITGVDINKEALNTASKNFNDKTIKYIQDDANNIKNIVNSKFNGIISFETIEHIKNPSSFLKSIYSLLNNNYPLIISTPNVLVTGHQSKADQRFHEKEYTPGEFYDLIKNVGFSDIKLYGQQFTNIGKLRNNIRHELNILNSNPFQRIGMWFQSKIRKYEYEYPLPEHLEDFEIIEYSINECEKMGKSGPFTLIITSVKI